MAIGDEPPSSRHLRVVLKVVMTAARVRHLLYFQSGETTLKHKRKLVRLSAELVHDMEQLRKLILSTVEDGDLEQVDVYDDNALISFAVYSAYEVGCGESTRKILAAAQPMFLQAAADMARDVITSVLGEGASVSVKDGVIEVDGQAYAPSAGTRRFEHSLSGAYEKTQSYSNRQTSTLETSTVHEEAA